MQKTPRTFFQKFMAVLAVLALATVSAFATPTALTVITLKLNNYPVIAGDLTLAATACDASNGNSFLATGQEILIVNNTGGSAYTFTVTSVADHLGRSDTSLTTYSVAAGVIVGVQMKFTEGWTSGTPPVVSLTCSNAALKYSVLRIQ